jgi:hypothetical protein
LPHRHTSPPGARRALSAERFFARAVYTVDNEMRLRGNRVSRRIRRKVMMRDSAGYLLIGSFTMLAMSLATIAGLGLAVGARPLPNPARSSNMSTAPTRATGWICIRRLARVRCGRRKNSRLQCRPAASRYSAPWRLPGMRIIRAVALRNCPCTAQWPGKRVTLAELIVFR